MIVVVIVLLLWRDLRPGCCLVRRGDKKQSGGPPHGRPSSSLSFTTLPPAALATQAVPTPRIGGADGATISLAAANATAVLVIVIVKLAECKILTPLSGLLLRIFLPSTKRQEALCHGHVSKP